MYKLFIADDEKIIIQGLKKLLDWDSLNIEISGEAINGKEAEEKIIGICPDLAILDVRMPLRTGLDILHTIKSRNLAVKVIFLSAYEEFGYARDALESGAFNYLSKPVVKEKLREVIESALSRIKAEENTRSAVERLARIDRKLGVTPLEEEFSLEQLVRSAENAAIRRILRFMDEHFAENITLERLAKMAFLNPSYFSVYFRKNTGLRFKECLTRIRLEHAAAMLKRDDIKTYEAAELAGFTDPGYFSEIFKKIYGKTPLEYKRAVKAL
ncbi:MAG: response regulator [Treponema sp.]|jgi:YesN/AraC family two-component response regulator|nr:response regulator [Treponema sp.]